MMLEINQLNFHLTIEALEFERLNFPSVQTEVKIHIVVGRSRNSLHFKSVWFDWDSVEAFFISLRQIVETNGGIAEIKDMSEKFLFRFSKSEATTLFTFKSEQNTLSFIIGFSIEVGVDTINIVHGQISTLVREMKHLPDETMKQRI